VFVEGTLWFAERALKRLATNGCRPAPVVFRVP
jgi:hypothetical protein